MDTEKTGDTGEASSGFEARLKKLEALVAKMESGEMGLEEMVNAFEEGQRLVRSCNESLNEVERRIEVIKNAGTSTEPLDEL